MGPDGSRDSLRVYLDVNIFEWDLEKDDSVHWELGLGEGGH